MCNYYVVLDFVVGGWCYCNGYVSSCFVNCDGKLVCDCKYYIIGYNCE